MSSPTSNSQLPSPRGSAASNEVLIRAENVGKKFCRSLKKSLYYGVQDVGYDLLGKNRSESELRKGEFWANQGISFELRRGECLGLIGHNGAGKTTLLKMLNGLIKPDQGSITMQGRVGALIALGAGFNPILTGRENIYINGSVLGLSKREIEALIPEIIEFSEIPDFIDTPVQNYSSGMKVRLGFAIASSMNPDILLLDEVLAVGDMSFVIKCLNRVNKLMENSAVILVSHRMQHISKFCSKVLLMDHGRVAYISSDVPSGVERYMKGAPKSVTLITGRGLTIENLCLCSQEDRHGENEIQGDLVIEQEKRTDLKVVFDVEPTNSSVEVQFTVGIKDNQMNAFINYTAMSGDGQRLIVQGGRKRVEIPIVNPGFTPGKYTLFLAATEVRTSDILFRSEGELGFIVKGKRNLYAPIQQDALSSLETYRG